MSLINEALKRARIEAARQEAADKGVPLAAQPVYVAPRRPGWVGPLAGFAAGLSAVAVAAVAFWLSRSPAASTGDDSESSPPAVSAPAVELAPVEAVPVVSAPAEPFPAEPVPAGVAPRPAATAAPPPATPPAAPRESSRQARTAPPPAARSREASTPVVESTPAPERVEPGIEDPGPEAATAEEPVQPRSFSTPQTEPRPAGAEQDEAYVREAVLPDGEPIKLDFIVWSESRPFAQINGELVHPGQTVSGFTLRTIERERVEIEAGGSRFWIRAK